MGDHITSWVAWGISRSYLHNHCALSIRIIFKLSSVLTHPRDHELLKAATAKQPTQYDRNIFSFQQNDPQIRCFQMICFEKHILFLFWFKPCSRKSNWQWVSIKDTLIWYIFLQWILRFSLPPNDGIIFHISINFFVIDQSISVMWRDVSKLTRCCVKLIIVYVTWLYRKVSKNAWCRMAHSHVLLPYVLNPEIDTYVTNGHYQSSLHERWWIIDYSAPGTHVKFQQQTKTTTSSTTTTTIKQITNKKQTNNRQQYITWTNDDPVHLRIYDYQYDC